MLSFFLDSSQTTCKIIKQNFQKVLDDQYRQKWQTSMSESSRFKVLNTVSNSYTISNYLVQIKNPVIRKIFTRLRIDMNVLRDCKARCQGNRNTIQISPNCLLCDQGIENVQHFLLECSNTELMQYREDMFTKVNDCLPGFSELPHEGKMATILDFNRLDKDSPAINVICSKVEKMYTYRYNLNID